MFINFNVDYRPGSNKSKFDMTLIRHSPCKVLYFYQISLIDSLPDLRFFIPFLNFAIKSMNGRVEMQGNEGGGVENKDQSRQQQMYNYNVGAPHQAQGHSLAEIEI